MIIDWYSLEKYIMGCSICHEKKSFMINRLIILEHYDDEFSISEANYIINSIEFNQLDPIISGFNYNISDIKRHLKKLR